MYFYSMAPDFYFLGLAMATRFAEEGAKVVVSSRKQAQVDQTVKSLVERGFEACGAPCHQVRAKSNC